MTRLSIAQFQVVGDELAIRWEDEGETYVGLQRLRENCPCAVCAGEPHLLGRTEGAKGVLGFQSFVLRELNQVGGYALQPVWRDGHSSGIYSFGYLRQLDYHSKLETLVDKIPK